MIVKHSSAALSEAALFVDFFATFRDALM